MNKDWWILNIVFVNKLMEKKPLLSIVSPIFNEEECIEEFLNRVESTTRKLPCEYEIILINDNSTDSTEKKIINIRMVIF